MVAKQAKQPEDIVKAKLRLTLKKYFLFAEEVKGDGPLEQAPKVDFWCYPKSELIALGFPPEPFVIEAKGHELEDGRKRTAIRVVYQAAMYALCQFKTKTGNRTPQFVLVYPPIAAILGIERKGEPISTLMDGVEFALIRLAAMFGVGEFVLRNEGFEVRFNGARYFDSERGKNPVSPLARKRTAYSR